MAKLNRRSFIAGASTIPLAWCFEGYAGRPGNGGERAGEPSPGPQPGVLVRYHAHSTEGQAMLQIYDRAVGKMQQAIAEGDPMGWVFQWYLHGGKGPSSTPDQNNVGEIARVHPSSGPHKALAEEIWNVWQAHSFSGDESFLLARHRMFLYFFEQVVRQVSGEASFTLPYWSHTHLASSLHDHINVLTGDGQNMGPVPWPAGDFWAHHCNVDRLWASWNVGGRTKPTDPAWLDWTFVFADAGGQRVEAKVGDFMAIAPLGYSYQDLEAVPA